MTISLVREGNRLIGRTLSDRWNLMQLGITSIAYDRNQTGVKCLRRALAHQGFALSVVRGGKPQWSASPTETLAFSGSVPAYLSQAA